MRRNKENRNNAEQIVGEVLALLDEERMAACLDAPIDHALSTFAQNAETPLGHSGFLHAISQMVLHVFQESHLCLFFPETLACGEAIHILELTYRGASPNGYESAYLEAMNPQQGIESVLSQMVEGLKALQRRKYVHWVFTTRIVSRDWKTRCQIVEAMKRQWQRVLPLRLLEVPSEELANEIPSLILIIREAQTILKQLCAGGSPVFAPETSSLAQPLIS